MDTLIAFEANEVIELNEQQQVALDAMIQFVLHENSVDAFILSGSAGTGKTTLLKEFTKYLERCDQDFYLLAPTGRAANIISHHSKVRAKTLHSFLYSLEEVEKDDIVRMQFIPRINSLPAAAILIVDESSLVSDVPTNNELFYSVNSLLNDLITFYNTSPKGTKLIFVGDLFQLPPVNENNSAALDAEILKKKYQISTISFNLSEVVRQKRGSYILQNAILLRNLMIQKKTYAPTLKYKNMYRPELAVAHFCKLFDPNDSANAVFLAYKNSTIEKLNNLIRKQLYDNPDQVLVNNEQVVLCKTTYKQAYLPSSEIGKVISFNPDSIEMVADIQFAEAVFQFITLSGETIEFKSKFDLDFLLSDSNIDSPERLRKLWADRKRNNVFFRDSSNPNDDPYLSAVKIRYGYAITTHKAQGGEWEHVFIYPEYPTNESRLKWIYTSLTRAKMELYSF